LNSIRPTTEAELDLLEMNKSMEQKFIEERLRLRGDLTDESREFQAVYIKYDSFCKNNNKKPLSQQYFSQFLKDNGYEVHRIQKDKRRGRYIQGLTDEIDNDDNKSLCTLDEYDN